MIRVGLPVLLLVAACSSSSYELTQAERDAMREQIERRFGDLPETLDLTEAQRAEAEPIIADGVRRMNDSINRLQEVGRRRTTTRELRRSLEQIRGEASSRLTPLLNEEQVRKLDDSLRALGDALKDA